MLLVTNVVHPMSSKLFTSPLEDPFLDSYIETVSHMNVKEIMSIPKLNDTEFIAYLSDDTRGFLGSLEIGSLIMNLIFLFSSFSSCH